MKLLIANLSSYFYKKRAALILLIGTIICALKIFLAYSPYSLQEVWFDEGINFYYAAVKYDFWRNFLVDDASYLSMVPRLVAVFIIKVLQANLYFPQLFKILNIFIFSIFISLLLAKSFDEYFGNFYLRLAVIFLIAFFPHMDLSYAANSAYGNLIAIIWFFCFFKGKKKANLNSLAKLFYFLLIPIIFITKPLISFAAIPVLILIIYQKFREEEKDLLKIYLALEALFSTLFQFIYVKYLKSFHEFALSNDYFDFSLSFVKIWKIIEFTFSSAGLALQGHNFLLFKSPFLSYPLGLIFCFCAVVFLSLRLKKFSFDIVSEIFLFLWIVIAFHAFAAMSNTVYPFASTNFFKLSKNLFHRQWWPIFSSVLLLYILMIKNWQQTPICFIKLKLFHHQIFLLLIILIGLFGIRKVDYFSKSPFSNSAQNDILPSSWRNYLQSEIADECILTNHFPLAISCEILSPENEKYVEIEKDLIAKPEDADFVILKLDERENTCHELSLISPSKIILPEFIPSKTRYFIFRVDLNSFRISSNCLEGAWIWFGKKK